MVTALGYGGGRAAGPLVSFPFKALCRVSSPRWRFSSMSVDWLINLKPLRDPGGSQIKLEELRIFHFLKRKMCKRQPLIAGDLHFCLDPGTGGRDEASISNPWSLAESSLSWHSDSDLTPSWHETNCEPQSGVWLFKLRGPTSLDLDAEPATLLLA